jgi:hypothetical protein
VRQFLETRTLCARPLRKVVSYPNRKPGLARARRSMHEHKRSRIMRNWSVPAHCGILGDRKSTTLAHRRADTQYNGALLRRKHRNFLGDRNSATPPPHCLCLHQARFRTSARPNWALSTVPQFDRSFNRSSFDAHDCPVRCCRAMQLSSDCQTDLSNTRALKHLTPLATDYWAASHSFVEPGHSCFHSKFEKIVSVSEFLADRMQWGRTSADMETVVPPSNSKCDSVKG